MAEFLLLLLLNIDCKLAALTKDVEWDNVNVDLIREAADMTALEPLCKEELGFIFGFLLIDIRLDKVLVFAFERLSITLLLAALIK